MAASDRAPADRASLLRLLVRHYDDLTRRLTRRMGSPASAQDVVQDTFVRVSGLTTVPDLDNPRAYLYRVAGNIALDHLRAEGRAARRHLPAETLEDHPSDHPSAEAVAEQRQRLARLNDAVNALPERCREVFLLHRIDGLSHAEIAARLGISRSAVEKHIIRALSHCRDRLVD
ncbi:RNA polymerase sigma factor [Novispirillum itersonii]|uniref:RNA polymerase sigma-70 factor (ECF subfamily) n=1 Tax=Novispirillum itersonii TaxID=189 RepID=A0A7W9ZI55_NOVIT|nr:RNA polymerase sigma factor [Novispirillum itersonii]MBB6211077.1 RNA polymerase sigma-70 factor (ECF subfamily) [Novispirillum itersonii]